MKLYFKVESCTLNLSTGGSLEVRNYQLDCPEGIALKLLEELGSDVSRKPFPGTLVEEKKRTRR